MSQKAAIDTAANCRAAPGADAPFARIVVRDADDGRVLYEDVGVAEDIEDMGGGTVVEHDLTVPTGSVVVVAIGGRRDAVAGAIAKALAVGADAVAPRLAALPAIAAFDLDGPKARSIVRAVARAGGRAIAV